MNALQSGDIAGEVVDGAAVGSHVELRMSAEIAEWPADGGRMRRSLTNTLVLRDGKSFWSVGTSGSKDPYTADDALRRQPPNDAHRVNVERRMGEPVIRSLAKLGVLFDSVPRCDRHLGSYQMCWRTEDGSLRSCTGPRRAGTGAAF